MDKCTLGLGSLTVVVASVVVASAVVDAVDDVVVLIGVVVVIEGRNGGPISAIGVIAALPSFGILSPI